MWKRNSLFEKVCILVVLGVILAWAICFFSGCSLLKKGIVSVNPAIANQQGQEDNNILKVNEINALKGDLSKLQKAFDTIQLKAVDTSRTESVGGNQTISNDSEMMKRILDTYKELSERYIKLLKYIIYVLSGLLTMLLSLVGWTLKFQMKEGRQDDRFKEDMLKKR